MILAILILAIFRVIKGFIYNKIYPYIVTYTYRLLFMEHIFTSLIFLTYINFSDPILIASLALLLFDILIIVVSLVWKVQTDT